MNRTAVPDLMVPKQSLIIIKVQLCNTMLPYVSVFLDSPLRGSQQQDGSKDGEERTQLGRRVPETRQDGKQVKDVQTGEVSQGRSSVLTLDTPVNHIGETFSQNFHLKAGAEKMVVKENNIFVLFAGYTDFISYLISRGV